MAQTRRRERELVAVAFNQKEQRVLEKSLATIQLEASYSLKLLDLHNRTVKVHFRQMKDKVSRIKSHLSPDEISKLRRLEAEGKLTPMYPPVSLGSAMKIAAAARRLNSSSGTRSTPHHRPPTRAKSALPTVNVPRGSTQQAPPPGQLKRSNSVSGAFIDAPPPRNGQRPGSAGHLIGGRKGLTPAATPVTSTPDVVVSDLSNGHLVVAGDSRTGGADSKQTALSGPRLSLASTSPTLAPVKEDGRPESGNLRTAATTTMTTQNHHPHFALQNGSGAGSTGTTSTSSIDSSSPKRPGTGLSFANNVGHPSSTGQSEPVRRTSARSRTTTSHSHHSRAPFSSHVATEKDAREEEGGETSRRQSTATPRAGFVGPFGSSLDRTSHGLGDDAVDDLGEDLFEERRQELLEEEQYRATAINRKKDRFLQDIDRYLKDHPPLRATPVAQKAKEAEAEKGKGAEDNGLGAMVYPRVRRRVEFDSGPTHLPEADYREKLMGLWTNMNKCRYLRVPDEMIDLSGINTLASETMKLFQALRHREMLPLSNAWAE